MKLNWDIIFDHLSQSVSLEHFGTQKQGLILKRPLLYAGNHKAFAPDQLYVAFSNQLPTNPVFSGEGATIICVKGRPPAIYMTGACICMIVMDDTDIFTIFNLLQEIYNRFDAWEEHLLQILDTTADIQELLEISFPIFENPMVVLGQDYHYLGYSNIINLRDDLAIFRPDQDGKIKSEILSASIFEGDTNMSMTNPFCILSDGNVHFSINLFDHGIYVGNLKIAFVLRPFRSSDNILCQYLAKILEKVFPKLSDLSYSGVGTLREIFQSLLSGIPLSTSKRQYLAAGNASGSYICLKMVRGERSKRKVPSAYFCDHMESTFPHSVAFEHDTSIVAFINVNVLGLPDLELRQHIADLLQKMNLKAGISNAFSDLYSVHYYYRQACIAFELGAPLHLQQSEFFFDDYTLNYMMYSCTGEFPVDKLYSSGFLHLLEYDAASQADYLGTLQTYLDNNMNIAKTAKDLFIHRTTLLERLKRIENLLNTDLKDPNQRLYLNLILKFNEIRRKLPEEKQITARPLPAPDKPVSIPKPIYQELETLL